MQHTTRSQLQDHSKNFWFNMNIITILQKNAEIWDLYSRKEEYTPCIRDKFNRFPFYASRNRNIFEPIASKFLIENGYKIQYPENAPFAVCLTHDVDSVYTSIPAKGLSVFRHLIKGNVTEAFHTISEMRSRKIPLWNFSKIMDIEEKFGAKSSFYFMVENPEENDYTYSIEDLSPGIREIIDRGWEVGLHGGHTTYLNVQEMKKKKERLERVSHKPVIGYRNHFLRFIVPDTWEYLSKSGFKYDTTFGYADCTGFRNGMCHPFRPFNLTTEHEIEIMEIPLIVMDNTLDQTYMRLDSDEKWENIKQLIDTVETNHGVFTLLWHNSYFTGENLALYQKILAYCHGKNAWMTSASDIYSLMVNDGNH